MTDKQKALTGPDFDPDEPEIEEQVTAVFAEQKFSPIQFHFVSLGPYYYRTSVRTGETRETAMARAQKFLDDFARRQWPGVMKEFLERAKEIGSAARSR